MVEANGTSRQPVPSGLLSQFLNAWRDSVGRNNVGRDSLGQGDMDPSSLAGFVASQGSIETNSASGATGVNAGSTAAQRPEANLGNMAQDLATPINVIAGAAWNLKEECSPEDRQFWIDCILRNVLCAQNRVEDLKDEVLDASGVLEVELKEMDLSSVVREAVQDFIPLAQDHGLQFYGDPACILGDAERIRRLVFNLLCNAINQSEAGREIKVDVWRRGALVCFFMQDQGTGPRPNQNEQVFLPFKNLECNAKAAAGDVPFTDSITLSSVQRIATAHGATVKVQGASGHGTIYEISFRALSLSQRRET